MLHVPSTEHLHRARSYVLIAALLVMATMTATLYWSRSEATIGISNDSHSDPIGSGSLAINGQVYDFSAEHCVITEDNFIATGSGTVGNDNFEIAASISSVELTVGSRDPDNPNQLSEGAVQLRSEEPPVWQSNENGVTAAVALVNPSSPESLVFNGQLRVSCSALSQD